jgi:hypothetical protein
MKVVHDVRMRSVVLIRPKKNPTPKSSKKKRKEKKKNRGVGVRCFTDAQAYVVCMGFRCADGGPIPSNQGK